MIEKGGVHEGIDGMSESKPTKNKWKEKEERKKGH